MPTLTFDDLIPKQPRKQPAGAGLTFDDLIPQAAPTAPDADGSISFDDLVPDREEAPAPTFPGFFDAMQQGAVSGMRSVGQTAEAMSSGRPQIADHSPAAEPFEWQDLTSPLSRGAPKVGYRLAEASPTLAGGIVGGLTGAVAGSPAGPPGKAAGAVAGGAIGSGVAAAAQTLGPYYAAALEETPDDPDGAFDRAMTAAATSGAFSAAGWAMFPIRAFQGPIKNMLFQTFGVQPAVSVAHKATSNVQEGRPIDEGLGSSYAEGAVMTAVPAVGHRALRAITPGRGAPQPETPQSPSSGSGDGTRPPAAAASDPAALQAEAIAARRAWMQETAKAGEAKTAGRAVDDASYQAARAEAIRSADALANAVGETEARRILQEVPPPGGEGPPRPPELHQAPIAPPPGPRSRRQVARDWKTNIVEYFQDAQARVRYLQERVAQGKPLPDDADPYLKATLYHGRVGTKVERGYDAARSVLADVEGLAKTMKWDFDAGRKVINDYLIARHAPERNAMHGERAAGVTSQQARNMVRAVENHPQAAQIKAIADKATELHRQSLDMLRESGVISPETHARLRTAYKNHVPLNRIFEGADDVGGILAGKGFDVYSTGIKRAKGSELRVSDVLANVVLNYEQAVLRSEKNLVDRATLNFVRKHRADLHSIMRETRPKVIGQRSDGAPIYEQSGDPRILHLFENGKPVWIKIEDPRLAAAFRGINREKLPTFLSGVAWFTRFYSSMATRFNPDFALPNKLRDLQETLTYMAADRRIGGKAAAKVALRDPASIKSVTDSILGRDTPGARLYQEMKDAGGTTGGMGLSTRKQVELNIAKLEALQTSSPRKFAAKLVEYVDNWNTIFEDSTRLSVYKSALEQGLTKERAAFLAKEASVNFNRMGTAGPVVNALWMFSNASIQGSAKMLRSLRNPKVASALGLTLGAAVAAVSEWNDRVDPEWRDKVTKWDRLNSLTVLLPSDDEGGVRYVAVPVSWGIKPLHVAVSQVYDMASGVKVDLSTALSDFASSVVDAYNPAGGTDLLQGITPTFLDVPVDLGRNQKWTGSKIRPDQDPDLPRDKQYFLSQKDTSSGRLAIETSAALRDYTGMLVSPADLQYATEQYISGAGRFVRKTLDTVLGAAKGEPAPATEYPFMGRFYRQRTEEDLGRGSAGEMDTLRGLRADQSRARFDARDQADDEYRRLKTLPLGERQQALRDLIRQDRATGAAVAEMFRDDQLGLTQIDRSMKKLGVENGERARYIFDRTQGMTVSEREKKFVELRRKGLMPPEVFRQVRTLIAGRPLVTRPPRVKMPAIDLGR